MEFLRKLNMSWMADQKNLETLGGAASIILMMIAFAVSVE